jgi:pimeloyl-ACP methyl ester carboxylesterase
VQDLYELLVHLGLGPVHLGGCSMGANVARDLAIAHPELTQSLMLIGAGAGSVNREHFLNGLSSIAKDLERHGTAPLVRSFENSPARVSYKEKDPRGFAEFLRQIDKFDATACAHIAREVLAKRKTVFELERELRALQTPTLIMVGDRDAPCVEPSLLMRNWMPHAGS